MKVALDTNILAYAEGVNGAERRDAALDLVRRLPQATTVIPVQVLGELFNVLVRKAGRSRAAARDALLAWRDAFPVVGTSAEVMLSAADLASDHRFGIWDAVDPVRRFRGELPAAPLRGPSGGLHLGRRHGGQSFRPATPSAAARAAARPGWVSQAAGVES